MKYTVLLTTLTTLGLAACGNKEASLPQTAEVNPPAVSAPAATDQPASAAAPAPAVPVPAPVPVSTAKPVTKPASMPVPAPIPAATTASPAAPVPTPTAIAKPVPAPTPAPTPSAKPAPVSHAGQAKFKTACAGCHGQQAQGQGTFPKLVGQSAADLKAKLEKYRKGEKVGPMSAVMTAPAKALSDSELDEVAGYIAGLK